MNDVYSIRHADQRAIASADQVELMAIADGLAVIDSGVMDENLSGELNDLSTAEIPMEDWQKQDVQFEDEVGAVRGELERRGQLLGQYYPFNLTGGALKYTGSTTGFYEYCLAISNTSKPITKIPYTKLPRSFERIVGKVLQKHMGPKWEALHTGWPRDKGQPRRFDAMLQNVSPGDLMQCSRMSAA